MADAILMKGGAGGVDCDSATAGKPQILTPYTAGIAGYDDPQQGSMPDRSGWASSIDANGKVMIPNGYHNGAGYVNQNIPVYGGATLTPGTSDQTIAAGRYLTGDIYVPGSGNLQSQYIANGVNIFGVTGNLNNWDKTQQVYNGSSFMNFMNGGLIHGVNVLSKASGGYLVGMSGFNGNNTIGQALYITSGSLYINGNLVYDSDKGSAWKAGYCASYKSINMSLFSSVTVGGYFTYVATPDYPFHAYIELRGISTSKINNSHYVEYSAGNSANFQSPSSFSLTIDTSSFAGNEFLGIYAYIDNVSADYSGHAFYITNITLNK